MTKQEAIEYNVQNRTIINNLDRFHRRLIGTIEDIPSPAEPEDDVVALYTLIIAHLGDPQTYKYRFGKTPVVFLRLMRAWPSYLPGEEAAVVEAMFIAMDL